MPSFDDAVNRRVCAAFDEAGIFDRFVALCRQFALEEAGAGPRLTATGLGTALARHITPVKALSRYQTVQAGMEAIGTWTWFGAIVVQHGAVLEVMFEGMSDGASAGSTLHDMRDTALEMRAAPGRGPPYLRPAYDGNDQRLEQMVAALAGLVEAMKEVVRGMP